ncbi:WbqC family protein [Listeria grandensis]|uniref:WbqC family protein n=1 Tax=Listeria TaxID=1637 RepID=UPI001623CA03|nr:MULTISPECIES: WbqC family protein [Listeria]MBC1474275.1 WbqC family protein [Listeria grandensis]MBC6129750.1 WbqC family protein [Listeria booriae]MBC6164585.1 WbqC family protein [Listeria booriae]
MKIIAIHQPNFLPWIGFFHKIFQADEFIYLVNVKYSATNFQNKALIYGMDKTPLRLTVPLKKKPDLLNEKIINIAPPNHKWKEKHLTQFRDVYRKAPYFDKVYPMLEEIYQENHDLLATLNISIINKILAYLDYEGTVTYAEEITNMMGKTNRLVDLVEKESGTIYLSGKSGADYLDVTAFEAKGINVQYQEFKHPIYAAKFGDNCLENLSIIDWMMYESPEIIKAWLVQGKGSTQLSEFS